jgi:hypothetical protein
MVQLGTPSRCRHNGLTKDDVLVMLQDVIVFVNVIV